MTRVDISKPGRVALGRHFKTTNSNICGTILSIIMINMPNYMFFGILKRIKYLSKPGRVALGRHLEKWPPTNVLKTIILYISGTLLSILMINMSNYMFFGMLNQLK